MFLRSYSVCLFGAALTLASFGPSEAKAITQTTYNFNITYSTEFIFPLLEQDLRPEAVDISGLVQNLPPQFQEALPENLASVLINPEILDVRVTGESINSNPPFGLANFTSDTFGLPLPPQVNPETGLPTRQVSIFRANPADLSVNVPPPAFSDVYFGDDTNNKLFGLANDQAIFNFVEGTVEGFGTITIVGGEGIFEGASGQIEFTQRDVLAPPGVSTRGEARLDFSVQVAPQAVPEPKTNATLAGVGVIGTLFLLRQRRQRSGLG